MFMCNVTNDEFVSKAELIRHLRFLLLMSRTPVALAMRGSKRNK